MKFLTPKRKAKIGAASMCITLFFHRMSNRSILGKCLFCFYQELLRCFNMSVLPVVNADLYKEKTGNIQISPIETNRKGVAANIIMAGSDESVILTEKAIPDLRLKVYRNVCIQGNSDVIVDVLNGVVISEEAYNLEENLEIIDGLLYRTSDNVCLLRDNLRHPKMDVSTGIMISGKFCNNYYHLMFENFIKLMYLNKLNIPQEVPIIIDRKTLSIPSCRTVFNILTENCNRPIYEIDSNKLYCFDFLYCLDHVNKLSSHSKDPHKPSTFLYSPQALELLRNCLLSKRSAQPAHQRIFISRAGSARRNFNEDEVFSVLQKYGFERLAPEDFSFEEQMTLFNDAKFIVAGSGAALTNLLFVNRECTVVCFGRSSYNEKCDIPVFNTIAAINGARFYFFPRKNRVVDSIHVNFEIDCGDFERQIKKILE